MEVDDIISYHDVVTTERAALQKGMNYGVGKNYSVFLMSLRENAPYSDALDPVTGMLTYEGHDEPQRRGGVNPKEVDQLLTTLKGSWSVRRMWFNEKSAFRSRHSVFQRRKQLYGRECPLALREAQSGEVRQDPVDSALDFCWSRRLSSGK